MKKTSIFPAVVVLISAAALAAVYAYSVFGESLIAIGTQEDVHYLNASWGSYSPTVGETRIYAQVLDGRDKSPRSCIDTSMGHSLTGDLVYVLDCSPGPGGTCVKSVQITPCQGESWTTYCPVGLAQGNVMAWGMGDALKWGSDDLVTIDLGCYSAPGLLPDEGQNRLFYTFVHQDNSFDANFVDLLTSWDPDFYLHDPAGLYKTNKPNEFGGFFRFVVRRGTLPDLHGNGAFIHNVATGQTSVLLKNGSWAALPNNRIGSKIDVKRIGGPYNNWHWMQFNDHADDLLWTHGGQGFLGVSFSRDADGRFSELIRAEVELKDIAYVNHGSPNCADPASPDFPSVLPGLGRKVMFTQVCGTWWTDFDEDEYHPDLVSGFF